MTIIVNNRNSYKASFKRKVIQFAEFNVLENNIRRWRKNKEVICAMFSKMKVQRFGISPFLKVCLPLKQWVMNERAALRLASALDIASEAISLATERGMIDFTDSSSWVGVS